MKTTITTIVVLSALLYVWSTNGTLAHPSPIDWLKFALWLVTAGSLIYMLKQRHQRS